MDLEVELEAKKAELSELEAQRDAIKEKLEQKMMEEGSSEEKTE